MDLLRLQKIILIIVLVAIVPFAFVLISVNMTVFKDSFYREKFAEYKSDGSDGQLLLVHEQVLDFLKGKTSRLPDIFNEREKQHLMDVKKLKDTTVLLSYILIFLFLLLMVAFRFVLKSGTSFLRHLGIVMIAGGVLTVILGVIVMLSINYGFSSFFELFHRSFFGSGTYAFDPAQEVIVQIYPEKLFMELGMLIARRVLLFAFAFVIIGCALLRMIHNKNI